MEKERIEIRFLGEFSISSSHFKLEPTANNSSQLALLLSALITSQSGGITKDALIEILWPDESTKDLIGALRTLIYRARKELKKLYPEQKLDYIRFVNDTYLWNPDLPCHVDIFEFEELNRKAKAEPDKEKKYKLYKKMHALYKGDYLSSYTAIETIMFRNIYFRNLYIQCTLAMCDYLLEVQYFDKVLSLCDVSLINYQEEEKFYSCKMLAFLGLGQPEKALDCYHTTVSFFSQKFGVDTVPSFADIYREILTSLPTTKLNLDTLENNLKERTRAASTYYCDFTMFRNFYQISQRSIRRTRNMRYLTLLTVVDTTCPDITTDLVREYMDVLFEIISKYLRQNDIFTRSSDSQYSLILTVANEYGCTVAIRRIKEHFQKKCKNPAIQLDIAQKLID